MLSYVSAKCRFTGIFYSVLYNNPQNKTDKGRIAVSMLSHV